jgi:hypothetical protein
MSKIKSDFNDLNLEYHDSINNLTQQKFEQRELLAVSNLMDEKSFCGV